MNKNQNITGVKFNEPSITMMPIRDDELEEYLDTSFIYLLYKTINSEKINIGVPFMDSYYPRLANMNGAEKSLEKKYFISNNNLLNQQIKDNTERPIYELFPDDDRTVSSYRCLGNLDIPLEDLLNGNYEIKKAKAK